MHSQMLPLVVADPVISADRRACSLGMIFSYSLIQSKQLGAGSVFKFNHLWSIGSIKRAFKPRPFKVSVCLQKFAVTLPTFENFKHYYPLDRPGQR